MKAKRIVVKVGSSSLTDEQGRLSEEKMRQLADQIAVLQLEQECRVILVSSGAVAAGLGKLGWPRPNITMPEKQAAAAVGQGLLLEQYQKLFAQRGITVAQLLLTRSDIEDRKRFIHIRNTSETLLRNGILPIVNENDTVTVEEIRFGDNDTLGSLVALVTEAELLILLTDIDGLYTANPKSNPDARRIPDVWEITPELEAAAGGNGSVMGTGGMRTKLMAARIATESGIDVVVASSREPEVLQRIAEGESLGTRFHANPRFSGKKSWLAHGPRPEGRIIIDQGAVRALTERAGSLLVPGITAVEGEFQEGAIVEIAAPAGQVIGKGAVSFSDRDLQLLIERRQTGERLRHYHEVIHRDAMVIYSREGIPYAQHRK
ncbi:glutamate 5-kinase [Effusibacillus lacus]|uniref:Glutamate 5-kinase n=1 Tax=Effusibacillus lacus TaxID=1348429 RepID=A0A292YKJ8_9BACL|nr:glutamate 5-kinase [Effusibacillus lacus]GAX89000.1 glutamate 5-kinase [Effusibacillus lacus]